MIFYIPCYFFLLEANKNKNKNKNKNIFVLNFPKNIKI